MEHALSRAKRGDTMKIFGIVLLVIGLASLAWPVIQYTTTETVVDIGPVEVTAERQRRLPIPMFVGGLSAVAGLVLLVAGARRT
jgi:uncharacterized membrane protein HdeD (DUF308 family)